MADVVYFYHYTDRDGLKGILKARRIFQSSHGKYGKGVYFTRLSPNHGRKKIAKSNWDGIWSTTEDSGKVDYTIAVKLPKYRVERHHQIYVFRQHVYIDHTKYKLYSVDGDHHDLESELCDDSDSSSSYSSSSYSSSSSSSDSD